MSSVLMKNEDSNGDNRLSWREMLGHRYKYADRDLARLRRESLQKRDIDMLHLLKQIEDDRELFKASDVNKDGFLDGHEFALFLHPWRYPEMYGFETKKKIEEFDADKDGYINLKEYLKLRGADEGDAEDIDIKQRRFQKLDINGDKKLEFKELLSGIKSPMERNAEKEAKHLMNHVDTDKDRMLSLEEMNNGLNMMLSAAHEIKEGGDHTEL